jgi:hypothetical protein
MRKSVIAKSDPIIKNVTRLIGAVHRLRPEGLNSQPRPFFERISAYLSFFQGDIWKESARRTNVSRGESPISWPSVLSRLLHSANIHFSIFRLSAFVPTALVLLETHLHRSSYD